VTSKGHAASRAHSSLVSKCDIKNKKIISKELFFCSEYLKTIPRNIPNWMKPKSVRKSSGCSLLEDNPVDAYVKLVNGRL
jgi:hypothetical protein